MSGDDGGSPYVALWLQFDEEFLPFEAQLANLRPGERVDFGDVLKDENAHVSNGQVQRNLLVILGGVHFDAVQFHFAGGVEEVQVGIGRQLTAVWERTKHDVLLACRRSTHRWFLWKFMIRISCSAV